MLIWRFTLGTLFVVAFLVVCGFDVHAARPGTFLLPLAVVLSLLSAGELVAMFRKRGHTLLAWPIYAGTAFTVLAAAAPVFYPPAAADIIVGQLGWLGLGLIVALSVAIVAEMVRYNGSGTATTNVALSWLAILYAGGLMGVFVQLRLIICAASTAGLARENHWAMHMLLVFIFTVKISDIGQYAFGRIFGKHKLAPQISPGKTWEGAVGGVLLGSAVGAALILLALRTSPDTPTMIATTLYVVSLCIAGIIGDLAESMLKRDAGVKDSSTWMPGFGGVLDLLDSLLGAAPVAYLFWAMHWIG
ncbi:MAG TPA: CDP-archaeol synthase [Lacipirellulaceae bacterium]